MQRAIRLLLLILERFSAAIFLWPLGAVGFSRRIWESIPNEYREIDSIFEQSGHFPLGRDPD